MLKKLFVLFFVVSLKSAQFTPAEQFKIPTELGKIESSLATINSRFHGHSSGRNIKDLITLLQTCEGNVTELKERLQGTDFEKFHTVSIQSLYNTISSLTEKITSEWADGEWEEIN